MIITSHEPDHVVIHLRFRNVGETPHPCFHQFRSGIPVTFPESPSRRFSPEFSDSGRKFRALPGIHSPPQPISSFTVSDSSLRNQASLSSNQTRDSSSPPPRFTCPAITVFLRHSSSSKLRHRLLHQHQSLLQFAFPTAPNPSSFFSISSVRELLLHHRHSSLQQASSSPPETTPPFCSSPASASNPRSTPPFPKLQSLQLHHFFSVQSPKLHRLQASSPFNLIAVVFSLQAAVAGSCIRRHDDCADPDSRTRPGSDPRP